MEIICQPILGTKLEDAMEADDDDYTTPLAS